MNSKKKLRHIEHIVCPRINDPFYIVTYYIKWVTTSWTHSINHVVSLIYNVKGFQGFYCHFLILYILFFHLIQKLIFQHF